MEIYYFTHTGNVRKNNEDALLIHKQLFSEKDFTQIQKTKIFHIPCILTVADGMGGHAKGEVASFLVLETLRQTHIHNATELKEILLQSKIRLNEYVKQNPNSYGMGTVVAGIVFTKNQKIVFNIGDCRVYQYSHSQLQRISKDHSVVEELKDKGVITEEEVRTHPQKHIITSSLSGDNENTLPPLWIRTIPNDNTNPEIYLICSDGLWEMLSHQDMERCFDFNSMEEIANCLRKKSFQTGAYDNISFILIYT